MELEQVKKDFDNGVMICRGTWARVLEAAVAMQSGLAEVVEHGKEAGRVASDCLERVGKL